ncbi:LysR family transcriptional regulator [Streptomyces sp. NBC_01166]|uniref:LysR family transcriptional regulator n=1 Tax=Streptomyces sp. NBC_01166 TaxID=2903755 RepID=UPI0038638415|nr:LysR family transcriptional regulator [Streptomyces sp. NBC_01166]
MHRTTSPGSMTLVQLRAFVEAERLGSFTAAAQAMDIAQASASELVRRLEAELDAELFVRGSRTLTLTSAGEELLPYAQEAVAAADSGARAVHSLGSLGGGTATFGVLRNADYYLLANLVQMFHARYPAVRVRLVGQNSAETALAVAAGRIEAGLVVLPIDDEGLAVTPLMRDEVHYVSASAERARTPVTIETFSRAPLVLYDAHYGWKDPTRRQIAERAQLAGVRVDPLIELERVEAALELVAAGAGDTIASRAVIASPAFPAGLHTAPFAEPLYDTIALVRRVGHPLSRATRELARLAEDTIREMGHGLMT